MLFDWRKIQGLPVYTVSGNRLGILSSVVFDVQSNVVFQYEVRTRFIGGRTFLINPNQVVEWQKDRVIVEDGVIGSSSIINFVNEIN